MAEREYSVGNPVVALYPCYYVGVISEVSLSKGTFSVTALLHDRFEEHLHGILHLIDNEEVEECNIATGLRVASLWQLGSSTFWPAVISEVHPPRDRDEGMEVTVTFDDGDVSRVPMDSVRELGWLLEHGVKPQFQTFLSDQDGSYYDSETKATRKRFRRNLQQGAQALILRRRYYQAHITKVYPDPHDHSRKRYDVDYVNCPHRHSRTLLTSKMLLPDIVPTKVPKKFQRVLTRFSYDNRDAAVFATGICMGKKKSEDDIEREKKIKKLKKRLKKKETDDNDDNDDDDDDEREKAVENEKENDDDNENENEMEDEDTLLVQVNVDMRASQDTQTIDVPLKNIRHLLEDFTIPVDISASLKELILEYLEDNSHWFDPTNVKQSKNFYFS